MAGQRAFALFAALLLQAAPLHADPGVLIPRNVGDRPDASILSLDRMEVAIDVVERFARVKTLQVFRNHTGGDLEAEFGFQLPAGTSLSDFAIWEEGIRIPGVILERARARMHYEGLTANKIDPGLLERSEHAEQSNTFGVKVFPVPANGFKRIELEYTQELPVLGGRADLVYPLKPVRYQALTAHRFEIDYRVRTRWPLTSFTAEGAGIRPVTGKQGSLEAQASGPATTGVMPSQASTHEYSGRFGADDFAFAGDFSIGMVHRRVPSSTSFRTYRDSRRVRRDLSPFGAGRIYSDSRGYFQLDSLFDLTATGSAAASPRSSLALSILFDCSLSMQWQKLDEAYEVLRATLERLRSGDRFTIALFNDEVTPFGSGLTAGGPAGMASALQFVRGGSLAGGTDLARAIRAGLAPLASAPAGLERHLFLITDGHATDMPLAPAAIEKAFAESNRSAGVRFTAFGIGSDANRTLLARLAASSRGQFAWASETEDVTTPLRGFLDRMGKASLDGLAVTFAQPDNVEMIYPSSSGPAFDQCSTRFVGRYKTPVFAAGLTLSYSTAAGPSTVPLTFDLPENDLAHPELARVWARERVDHLLERITFEGEQEEWIEEIIGLSRQHKFVTPYTSFLAAPRALLRPRVIKPGDPTIRVETGEDVRFVAALLPFGDTLALTKLTSTSDTPPGRFLWETRFLVPSGTEDGTYEATLVLSGLDGKKTLAKKNFRVDSRPPVVRLALPAGSIPPGGDLFVRAYADADTRRLIARLLDLPPVELRYDAREHASTGRLRLPHSLPAGTHLVRVSAEDFAHNVAFVEGQVIVR